MIVLPKPPKIVDKKDNWARIEVEGLYPGYGLTIGNSLRRVLLSSLEGVAITQVKIKGAQHEFSTISGVLEDVVTIMMNLKKARFKMHSEEPQKATLKEKGEKKISGKDFKLPSQVELINKDCHVATLTNKNTELEMEIIIEKGVGYEPVERRKKEGKLEIGLIPLDAVFTPVRKVSYSIENMRVGERTDFDRLNMEIETDGSVTPEETISQASNILVEHFSLIGGEEKSTEPKEEELAKEKKEDPSKIKVEDLGLSSRTESALHENNIKTVGGVIRKKEDDILNLSGMGDKGLKEIKKALKKYGLEIKSE